MSALREKPARYWVKTTAPLVNVWRRPLQNLSRLSARARRRNLQTQALRTDLPLRVWGEQDGWRLVQMADLTGGWVQNKYTKRVPTKDYWRDVKRYQGRITTVPISSTKFLTSLKKYPPVKYVWGGRSRRGRDCSACVQDVFYKQTGYLLPRNSRDQARLGRAVNTMKIGDLVFGYGLRDGVAHIGIAAGPDSVFHLSQRWNRPRIEKLSELRERYKLVAIKRLFKFND
jgi:hypothetical protein